MVMNKKVLADDILEEEEVIVMRGRFLLGASLVIVLLSAGCAGNTGSYRSNPLP